MGKKSAFYGKELSCFFSDCGKEVSSIPKILLRSLLFGKSALYGIEGGEDP